MFDGVTTLVQKQVFIAVILVVSAVAFRFYVLGSESASIAEAASTSGGEIKRSGTKSPPKTEVDQENTSENISRIEEAVETAPPDETTALANEPALSIETAPAKETALGHAKRHLNVSYVCPMHPSVVSTKPNQTCPICEMKLVLVERGGEGDTVTVTPGVINLLGVRTEVVKKRTLFRRIDSVGYVAYDEGHIKTISLRVEGWIEHLAVKTVGVRVKKGDLLFEVYSPKLVNAQEEFITALSSGSEDLVAASFGRLNALGVSLEQMQKLERLRKVEQLVKYYAPQDGVVSELTVREGGFVAPATPVINLANLSSVWMMVNVFERQADWVKVGNKAEATLSFQPDKIWEGVVEYIYPNLDPKTRSLQVRIRFDNTDEALKPNMYADVRLFTSPKREAISVPREALIRTGDSSRIILALGGGRFKPVAVSVGIETGDRIEILEGLDEGANVVVSSQFLIDSESSLRAALLRMNGI